MKNQRADIMTKAFPIGHWSAALDLLHMNDLKPDENKVLPVIWMWTFVLCHMLFFQAQPHDCCIV